MLTASMRARQGVGRIERSNCSNFANVVTTLIRARPAALVEQTLRRLACLIGPSALIYFQRHMLLITP